ncbi:nuclear transport factor 2 family protein [Leifsonia aquatica]|uniref:nuclear transport factor 2 family protein n=1 Tax=Leifsonia aquatica TaxID=144185 RepID=UPI00384AE7D6
MGRDLLIRMFDQMVVRKDATAIPTYYDPEFVMVSNGVTQDYAAFRASHEGVYDTEIAYAIEYDDDAWVEHEDRVAARVWITTSRPDEAPTRIEVVLIAILRDGRILRLWELTWPNWAELPAFEDYES